MTTKLTALDLYVIADTLHTSLAFIDSRPFSAQLHQRTRTLDHILQIMDALELSLTVDQERESALGAAENAKILTMQQNLGKKL